jgi:predicted nucleic acid-binding Zn ribbon protein
LLPGNWSRPYKRAPNVWEDEAGNRVIVGYAINYLTLRRADGTPGGCYDHQEPFRSALQRNPNRRRAGLAAARRFFEANAKAEP